MTPAELIQLNGLIALFNIQPKLFNRFKIPYPQQ
jgi:hypothetical protein